MKKTIYVVVSILAVAAAAAAVILGLRKYFSCKKSGKSDEILSSEEYSFDFTADDDGFSEIEAIDALDEE